MRLSILPYVLPAVLILFCAGPARAVESLPTDGVAIAAAAASPRHGALYRVSHEGRTGYLYGTIHVGQGDDTLMAPEAARALADASSVVVELDIRSNDAFQTALGKHGMYGDGDSIVHHVSPATLRQLVQALARAGIPLRDVERYKPWLIGNLLQGLELDRNGYRRSGAAEYVLLAAAKRQDKTVRELESADYQLAMFDALDAAQQEQYLRENLADLEDGNALKRSRDLIEAWRAADSPRIDAALHAFTAGSSVNATFMQTTLLGKRNPEMASAIERILQQDQVAFVGVGLLHLAGENGLPQLLKQRGYTIEQLY
ncbi:TraB/GumN family protein [Rugamonas apoptosis]|uniref:TraB/GumN family protein n=1 Tax=Rugamonas apoptosis TaxID=2758570 RepID=A0A7W2IMG9_9BURK|nr:TraB/GumN family protein [Rugamonas apoptosis]MBA5689521.1 TraB/GumN family protein [Rugamonas apoptosis]